MSYILRSSDLALYVWLFLIDNPHTLGTCSVSTASDLIFFVGHCDNVFHGPVCLPCISDSIKYEGIILWILVHWDTVNDLILVEDHCDLYFMAQCFCLYL